MLSPRAEDPRFSEWTPTNHQAPLWITTTLSLIYSCSFLFVRLVVKARRWALDDIVLGAAYVRCFYLCSQAGDILTVYELVSVAQWAMIYTALDKGAGRDMGITENALIRTPAKVCVYCKSKMHPTTTH